MIASSERAAPASNRQLAKLLTTGFSALSLVIAFVGRGLSLTGYLELYVLNYIAILLCLRTLRRRENWFLDHALILVTVYSLYYPLTAWLLDLSGVFEIDYGYMLLQARFCVAFIATFSICYLATIKVHSSDAPFLALRSRLFSRNYPNIVLVPLIFAPWFLKIAIIWANAGFNFQYEQVYSVNLDLKGSGLNLLNQINNVLAMFSLVALPVYLFKKIGRGQHRAAVLVTLGFLAISLYLGARSIFLTALLNLLLVYARYHRIRFRWRYLPIGAMVLLFYFGVEARRNTEPVENQAIYILGEPFTIFTNGLVFFGEGAGIKPPFNSYINDLTKIVPSYIYSNGKEMSTWYVKEFYPEAYAGGYGRAFGFNTEAMVNYGVTSIILQAAALGLLIGTLTRIRPRRKVAAEFIEVFRLLVLVYAYLMVRVTTFILSPMVGYIVLTFVAVRIAAGILRTATAPVPALDRGMISDTLGTATS